MVRSCKVSFFLLFIFVAPLFFCMPIVFDVWLGAYPNIVIEFCKLKLVLLLISAVQAPLWMYVQASGKIKKYQIIISIINLFNLPIGYYVLWKGCEYRSIFMVEILIYISMLVYRVYYLHTTFNLKYIIFFKNVLSPVLLVSLLTLLPCFFLYTKTDGIVQKIIVPLVCFFLAFILIIRLGLSNSERSMVNKVLINKIRKR